MKKPQYPIKDAQLLKVLENSRLSDFEKID